MNKKKIAIIFGGKSSEYEVSLKSAYSVINNLNYEKYEYIMLGISPDGNWYKYEGDIDKIEKNQWLQSEKCTPAIISPSRDVHGIIIIHNNKIEYEKIDVAFPVLHGKNGEDGTIQGLFELAGIPYVGCDVLSSALCMDKDLAHIVAKANDILIPEFFVVKKNYNKEQVIEEASKLGYPVFVKPSKAGSSFGITKAADNEGLIIAVEEAFKHDNKVVVEENVDGFEVGCAVLGNNTFIIGEVDEIEIQQGFFDYTEKYNLVTSKIHMPARIDVDTSNRIKKMALALYQALQCKGLARVDMFLTPKKQIVFNEINTLPGFTEHSRYPSMLKAIGMSFTQVLDCLIDLAEE